MTLERRLLESIMRVHAASPTHAPTQASFDVLLNELLDLTGSEYGFLGHVRRKEDGTPFLKTRAITNIAWTADLHAWYEENAPQGLEFFNLNSLFGKVLRSGELMIANETTGHPDAAGRPDGHPPLRRFLGIPLRIGDEFVGMAGVANRQEPFTEELVEQLRPLTSTIAAALAAMDDQEARRAAETRLRDSEERWKHALTGSDEGVWDWDIAAGTMFRSPRYLTQLGHGPGEDLGGWDEGLARVHPDERDLVRRAVQRVLDGETDRLVVEHRMRTNTDDYIWVLSRGSVVERDAAEQPRRLVGTQVDITARRETQRQLEEALRSAQEGVRAKSEFLAVMSHEIRTPMNGVIGMAGLLLDSELAPQQREFAETIRDSADALLVILNDILDLSKLEADRLELESMTFDVHEAVTQVNDLLRVHASAKEVALRVTTDGDTSPLLLRSDLGRVRQVAMNLIFNAIKFTEAGEVNVHLERTHIDEEPAIRISVRDTGIGVPPDRRGRLFQPFSQVDASMNRRFGGTGLGLAICQRISGALKGRIGYKPLDAGGSEFWFDVPVGQPESFTGKERLAADSSAIEEALKARGGRVLLVEDNMVNQRVTSLLLQRMGLSVESVANGLEALEALSRANYDLVLMDVQMPELDGCEATRRFRAREASNDQGHLPIVALTANAEADSLERCVASGMDDVLTKPLRRPDLVDCISRWLLAS